MKRPSAHPPVLLTALAQMTEGETHDIPFGFDIVLKLLPTMLADASSDRLFAFDGTNHHTIIEACWDKLKEDHEAYKTDDEDILRGLQSIGEDDAALNAVKFQVGNFGFLTGLAFAFYAMKDGAR